MRNKEKIKKRGIVLLFGAVAISFLVSFVFAFDGVNGECESGACEDDGLECVLIEGNDWCNGADTNRDGDVDLWQFDGRGDQQTVSENMDRIDCSGEEKGVCSFRDGGCVKETEGLVLGCIDNCVIDSVEWESERVQDGEPVNLWISGINCSSGNTIMINFYERDMFSEDDFVSGAFYQDNFVDSISYVPQFVNDEYGSPEFYAKVNLVGEENFVSSQLLKVFPSSRESVSRSKSFSFKEGKNLFTMPLIFDDMSMETVFGENLDKIDRIYTYEDGWKIYHPDETKPSNLYGFEVGRGYVLFTKPGDSFDLDVTGYMTDESLNYLRFNLAAGEWNLISIFYESYDVESIIEGDSDNELYVYNDVNGNYEKIEEGILNADESYWVYSNSSIRFADPEAGFPSLNFWQRILDLFKTFFVLNCVFIILVNGGLNQKF